MGKEVSIVGIGSTKFGESDDTLVELATEACGQAIEDAGIEKDEVDYLPIGNVGDLIFSNQATISGQVVRGLGLRDIPSETIEDACSSSSAALRKGYTSIKAGLSDVVLACGTEKMTSASTPDATRLMAMGFGPLEQKVGMTFPGYFAMLMKRYMHEFDAKREIFAKVSEKNHRNAVNNPIAHHSKEIKIDEVLDSPMIAEPLRLLDCCPISDGASAVVMCPSKDAEKYSEKSVEIISSKQVSGYSSLYETFDSGNPTTLRPTKVASQQAYKMAGKDPQDIDVVELHDCFTPAEIIDSEDLGFFEKGEGARAVKEGTTETDGKIPINPSGGLLSRGHPIGATGIAQIYELVKQLRGEAENQIEDANTGLAHNMGATAAVATVHILEKR